MSWALTHLTRVPLPPACRRVPEKCGQPANWALPSPLDFSEIGLGPSLARIGVGRNFAAFPLPGAMNRKQRLELEDLMAEVGGKGCGEKSLYFSCLSKGAFFSAPPYPARGPQTGSSGLSRRI